MRIIRLVCAVATVLLIGVGFWSITVQADPGTYYFANSVNTNPATLGNYWQNAGLTTPAAQLPDFNTDIVYITTGATFAGNIIFNGAATNLGVIQGDAVFNATSANKGSVQGNGIFRNGSDNTNGTIGGDATFYNDGIIGMGGVSGSTTFIFTENATPDRRLSIRFRQGTVIADNAVVKLYFAIYDNPTVFQTINGGSFIYTAPIYYFNNAVNTDPGELGNYWSNVGLTIPAGELPDLSLAELQVVSGATYAGNATFNVRGKNYGTVTGSANFNDKSENRGIVNGDAIFKFKAVNAKTVNGEAVYLQSATRIVAIGSNPTGALAVGNKLYVSNKNNDTVSVIDTRTDAVITTLNVGHFPEFFRLVGTKLYVTESNGTGITVIDTTTDTVLSPIVLGQSTYFSTLVGTNIYASTSGNSLLALNTLTNGFSFITTGVTPVYGTYVGDKVYFPNNSTSNPSVVDSKTNTVIATINTSVTPATNTVAIGTKVYYNSGYLVNTLTDTIEATAPVGSSGNHGAAVSAKLYIPTTSSLKVYNTNTHSLVATIPTSTTVKSMSIHNGYVYANMNSVPGKVLVIDSATDTVVETLAAADATYYSAVAGDKIYVSSINASAVTVIDTTATPYQQPKLVSFSSTTPDGAYDITDNIIITANFAAPLVSGSTMTILLNTGASVVLSQRSGKTLTGVYTIHTGEKTPDLAVASISSASITDIYDRHKTNYRIPSSRGTFEAENSFITRNLGDVKNIAIGSYKTIPVGSKPYQISAPITVNSIQYSYVANQGNATVSVLRLSDDTVVGTINVGLEPYGLVPVNVSGTTYVYVANTGSDTVSVINTASNTVAATVAVGVKPYYVAAIGTNVYVTNGQSNTVSVISALNNTVTATIPVGNYPRGIKAHGTDLYVADFGDENYANGTITVINSLNNTVTKTIVSPAGSGGPRGVTVHGSKVYVANFRSNNVSVIDTATNTITNTIPVGMGPRGMAVFATNVYVENFDDGTVSVIDTDSNVVTATIKVGHSPAGIITVGSELYISRFQDNEISILNTENNILEPILDTTPPVISSIAVTAATTSATITWITNEAASSRDEYGTTNSYGTLSAESDISPRVTLHSVTITGLNLNTAYHFRVISTDASNQTATSIDNTFTTGSSSGGGGHSNPIIPIIDVPLPLYILFDCTDSAVLVQVTCEARLLFANMKTAVADFIKLGTALTRKLGLGERQGVINSFKAAFGREPNSEADWSDVIKLSLGRWPTQRNADAEKQAEATFQSIYRRERLRTNERDDAAIMMMAYGMRPVPRELIREIKAVRTYLVVFKHFPLTTTAWDAVRAIAYSGGTR